MTEHTHDFSHWPFPDAVHTSAFCTEKVARADFPVLLVFHDPVGNWQFLDDTTDEPGDPVTLCLGCVFEKHADMAAIADLPQGWGASRDAVGAEWERWEMAPEVDQDDAEEGGPHVCGGPEADAKALADIAQYGLHVISVMEEDDSPPFTYSIGIEQSLGLPELIIIGLNSDVAHSAINACYQQMKDGGAIVPGARVADLLSGGFECLIGTTSPERVADYMGWAAWLYKDKPFRAYQIIWPSTTGVFPWEAGTNDWLIARQPLLA